MKILQVIDILNRGGAERVLVDLSNLLHQKGHQVGVLTLVTEGPLAFELHPDIRKLNLKRTNKYSLSAARKFMKLADEYDIIHLHMRHVLRYYFFCNLFFSTKARVVFHDHWGDIDFDKSVPFYLRWLRNSIYYIGVSRHLVTWAQQQVSIEAKRTFLLSNIVAIEFVEPQFKPSTGKILMISNFRRTKNIQFALKVMYELTKSASVTLDIYGRDQDVPYLDELRSQVAKLGLGAHVNFIVNASVRDKFLLYDAAIHTATSETGPLVLIEYLANQLPFLSYFTGEVSEQLHGSLPDYFKNDFDVTDWSESMRSIVEGRVRYPSSLLKSLFNTHYSVATYVQTCEDIYIKILPHGQA